ncbi:MAG: hypothetical protein WB647_15110, partial [Roseiarcus sp.]|uniref:hypothetical protein n=1 Tax=Roseiarcus sp. TaxID=1969460 RepID=UPI003C622880
MFTNILLTLLKFGPVVGLRGEEGPMGKAAVNERIKLRALWFNNLSVGLSLTGVLVPLWSLPKATEYFHPIDVWLAGGSRPSSLEVVEAVLPLWIIGLALVCAW